MYFYQIIKSLALLSEFLQTTITFHNVALNKKAFIRFENATIASTLLTDGINNVGVATEMIIIDLGRPFVIDDVTVEFSAGVGGSCKILILQNINLDYMTYSGYACSEIAVGMFKCDEHTTRIIGAFSCKGEVTEVLIIGKDSYMDLIVGCYNGDSLLKISSAQQSVSQCIVHCDGYLHFGLMNGTCHCLSELFQYHGVKFVQCSYFCDNKFEMCGGPNAVLVYNNDMISRNKRFESKQNCAIYDSHGFCTNCNSGWKGIKCEHRNCIDERGDCEAFECLQMPPKYSLDGLCLCEKGFFTPTQEETCEDLDECARNMYECDTAISKCENSMGGYWCSCFSGFIPDTPNKCVDDDECAKRTSKCNLRESTCENTVGSFRCICRIGYTNVDEKKCIDIDECLLDKSTCDPFTSTCKNTPGSFRCPCNIGYVFQAGRRGGRGICRDIDECTKKLATCNLNESKCKNILGSYRCDCLIGYTNVDDMTCLDVDECLINSSICHPTTSTCKNTQGSFECLCKLGYIHRRRHLCVDIDECTGINECDTESTNCLNNMGSYSCDCLHGFYAFDWKLCIDINECIGQTICHISSTQCTNYPGSFRCDCLEGFKVDHMSRYRCQDIDECVSLNHGCEERSECINTYGSYDCRCGTGMIKEHISKRFICIDINECQSNICDIKSTSCVNTQGSFACVCFLNYLPYDNVSCVKDDNYTEVTPEDVYYDTTQITFDLFDTKHYKVYFMLIAALIILIVFCLFIKSGMREHLSRSSSMMSETDFSFLQ